MELLSYRREVPIVKRFLGPPASSGASCVIMIDEQPETGAMGRIHDFVLEFGKIIEVLRIQ